MTLVDFETARAARGLRIVYADKIASPWSQAALGLFDLKGVDYVLVPFRPFAQAVREHTGANNAPVVLFDDEPPRTGWGEILALAERLGGRVSLVPDDDASRGHACTACRTRSCRRAAWAGACACC